MTYETERAVTAAIAARNSERDAWMAAEAARVSHEEAIKVRIEISEIVRRNNVEREIAIDLMKEIVRQDHEERKAMRLSIRFVRWLYKVWP